MFTLLVRYCEGEGSDAVGGWLRELTAPSGALNDTGSNPGVIQRAVPPQAGGSTKSAEGKMLTISHYLYSQGG